jgi:hypothetical protein
MDPEDLFLIKESIHNAVRFTSITMAYVVYVISFFFLLRTDYLCFRFYYPQGKPTNEHFGDVFLQKMSSVFQPFTNQQVPREKFDTVTKACTFFHINFLQNHSNVVTTELMYVSLSL